MFHFAFFLWHFGIFACGAEISHLKELAVDRSDYIDPHDPHSWSSPPLPDVAQHCENAMSHVHKLQECESVSLLHMALYELIRWGCSVEKRPKTRGTVKRLCPISYH
jgi:hypothetical protein